MNTIPAADARRNLSKLLDRVARKKQRIILTRRGWAVAALVSLEDLELLNELEDHLDFEAAYEAGTHPDEVAWETLKERLEL